MVKVIGAGFGRTGTMSLQAALEEIGFGPCYHMQEVLFRHPEHAGFWRAAWQGEPANWNGVLGGYESTVDWPGCAFYEELMERHPDAKVLLSVRDPERWYESARGTIYELTRLTSGVRLSRLLFDLLVLFLFGRFGVGDVREEIIWDGTFDGRFEDKAHAMEVFEKHNEEVKRRVPPEKLLVYEVKEGWGPLCEFLGVEVPDKPFPRLNDTAQIRRATRALRVLSVAVPTALALLLGGTVFALLGRRAGP